MLVARPDSPLAGIEVSSVSTLDRVDAAQWDRLAGLHDPFVEHAFLLALERGGCLGERTGWHPQYLLARDESGDLCGAVPLYLKDNSYGEYIFDWDWAQAASSAAIPYYPKLVAAVPFTPVTGNRLLVHPDAPNRDHVGEALMHGLKDLAAQSDASSTHLLFVTQSEQNMLTEQHDFLPRLTYQFRWSNVGYQSFEHYLSRFRHSARKNVVRERQRAAASGLRVDVVDGQDLTNRQWQALYRFYCDTTARKWGPRYLTRRFFELVRERFAHRVIVGLASRGVEPVAGALYFHKGNSLCGRYWGCLEPVDHLHFELCYYRPIELCIQRGLQRFEAGAQGVHKLKRGLLPCPTYSAHWLRHPALSQAVEHHLALERRAVEQEMAALAVHGPFRRDVDAPEAMAQSAGNSSQS